MVVSGAIIRRRVIDLVKDAQMKLSIWWLSQVECEAIGDELPDRFPSYMRKEYRSRLGRGARGRLWISDEAQKEAGDIAISVDPWPDTPLSKMISKDSGGIVILDHDAAHLQMFPGILTDLHLNRTDISIFA